ncbi:hypothetical protein F4679DRAFT_426115 [Xylaria curta]|nr:hypothetical protein F4679DRAFT_426115 [Xylaria curta]
MSCKPAYSRLMPSAIPPEYLMASSPTKKRRRDDNGEQVPLYAPSLSEQNTSFAMLTNICCSLPRSSTLEAPPNRLSAINHNERSTRPSNRGSASSFGVSRKVIALPVSKKFRLVEGHHHEQLHSHYLHENDFPPSAPLQPQQSHFSHAHPEQTQATSTSPQQTRSANARNSSSALLSPCHICHRKPTKKSDLDSFGDCMGCGERTCFVCLRACQGWIPDAQHRTPTEAEDLSASFTMHDVDDEESVHHHVERPAATQKPQQKQKKGEGGGDRDEDVVRSWNGRGHRDVICSRCCVEQGSEGDVVCLGCLAGMEGT